MNKYIIQEAKAQIEDWKVRIARLTIAEAYQSQFDTPAAKKEVDSAKHGIAECDGKIAWMQKYVKSQTKQ